MFSHSLSTTSSSSSSSSSSTAATNALPPPSAAYTSAIAELCQYRGEAFQRDFYKEDPAVAKMTVVEAEAFRRSKNITVDGVRLPNPIRKFTESSLPKHMLQIFKKEGFTQPSPIQCQGWPAALSGRDVIGVAETGSGKTLTFMLPAMLHVEAQPPLNRGDGPIALMLTPTRELAQQIQEEAEKYRRSLRIAVVYGGTPKGPQQRELTSGVEMVVATPGRLQDFMNTRITNVRRVTYLVLDEADKMLDMGLGPNVADICGNCPTDRQTLMFTATWSDEVQALSSRYLSKDSVKVKVGIAELAANHNISQTVQVIEDDRKADHFIEILKAICRWDSRILVFCLTKVKAEALTNALVAAKWPAVSIHGDKSQAQRDQALADFKEGKVPLVVATDVAARGLDIRNVEYVVNFDMPTNIENYIHRIGRTGRAGSHGKSISFFCDDDESLAHDLVQVLEEAGQKIEPKLWEYAHRARAKLASKEGRDSLFTKRKNRFSQRVEPYNAQMVSKIASGTLERPAAKAVRSSIGQVTEVLLLRNMVGPGEVDCNLKADVEDECSKYGEVVKVFIHEVSHWSIKEHEAVRIFVQFGTTDESRAAFLALNGRQFGGRTVCCCFYAVERFSIRDFEPSPKDPAMPHCLLLRNMATLSTLDEYLQADVQEECGTFGEVSECVVHTADGQPITEQVRVYIRFTKYEACIGAYTALHGRRFAGRTVFACFWDEALLDKKELSPNSLEPPMALPKTAARPAAPPSSEPPPSKPYTSTGVLSTGPVNEGPKRTSAVAQGALASLMSQY